VSLNGEVLNDVEHLQLIDDFHALYHLTDHDMLSVQRRARGLENEELAVGVLRCA
jgi:hypothetical protein